MAEMKVEKRVEMMVAEMVAWRVEMMVALKV